MARKRHIKPGFFENERLGSDETDPLISILFAGIWTLADRDGRLKDSPAWIKAKIFPYRTVNDPDGMLQWLADHGFIVRYQSDGKGFIQVTNWSEHQSPHPNEAASLIPSPFTETVTNGNRTVTNGNSSNACIMPMLIPRASNGVPPPVAAAAAANNEQRITNSEQPDDPKSKIQNPKSEGPVETRIWNDGVEILKRSGLSETQSRPLLGRLAKEYGKALLAECIAATLAENPADPKGFLVKTVRHRSRPNPAAMVGKYVPDPNEITYPDCPACDNRRRLGAWPDLTDCPECVGKLEVSA